MATRTLVFVALASLVMMAASMLQTTLNPPVPPGDEQAGAVAQLDENESPDIDDADSTTDESESLDDSEAHQESSESEAKEDNSNDPVADGSETLDGDADSPAATNESNSESDHKLYTLGSIAADSNFRHLVTFSSRGGSVHRVELNFRDGKDRYRYRDLEFKGGYLGELDCISTPLGCQIRTVGAGTPAATAGLKQGDYIKAIDEIPVVEAEDFAAMMANTKVGQTLKLRTERDGSENTVDILLTNKPIELIRPEPDFLIEGKIGDPSFRTTILATTPMEEVWPTLDANMMDGAWKLEKQTEHEISFSYTISKQQLETNANLKSAELGFAGPIKVTKSYRIPEVSDIRGHEVGARDFHFDLTLKIENLSDANANITYELDGPLGTPTETWWYQNKIHGRNTAVGYIAGARDVLGSTGEKDFVFYGGPELVSNIEKTEPKNFWILSKPTGEADEPRSINYLGVDTQYFNVSLLPSQDQAPYTAYSALADIVVGKDDIPDNAREKKLVDCTFKVFKSLQLAPGATYEQQFQVFAGPKEQAILEAYGLDDARSFGWFAIFSKPLCWLLKVFYYMTGKIGYGIPIILLTVLVRSLMIPISRRAAINAQMMQYLQPQMKEIADKFKDDMEKRAQAQRSLFKRYNYNPFGGCFMMFLQIPIFIGLYRGLSVDIALRDQPLIPGLNWCSDLSAPDQLWMWKEWLPGFLASETGWLGPYFNVLPIITCVLFIIQQKLFTPPPTDEQQEMMHKMMKYMMIFMGFLFFKVPAGLCLYFITSSLWGIIERKMLPKPQLDKSKLDDLLDGDDGPDKATLRRIEKERQKKERADAQRQADLEEKKRRDKERKKRLKRRDENS